MKAVEEIVAAIGRHLDDGWHTDLATPVESQWPRRYFLGTIASGEAADVTRELRTWSFAWHDWSHEMGLPLDKKTRRIGKPGDTREERLPTHITVPDIDAAARVARGDWTGRIRRARQRLSHLESLFPATTTARVLREAERLEEVDYHLAIKAAQWFATHDKSEWAGLTPRQVPVEGMQGKWLNGHNNLVRDLAGLDDLTLQQRPTRIYFTYLDPTYRKSGGRLHDSYTLTDRITLPYEPQIVLIIENKDTSVLFPELSGAIAVEGNGNASVGLLPDIDWIAGAEHLIYWGDLDARGYEIVNDLRARRPSVRTILMDQPTYSAYERFGTNHEPNRKPIVQRPRRPLIELTSAEREVYENLTTPGWSQHLRVEQERIPLETALAHVRSATGR